MTLAAADFAFVRDLVQRRAAIVLDADKGYLVESRLQPVARRSGEQSIGSLVARVRSAPDGPLASRVVEAMTINETFWFRDQLPFAALRSAVLPELLARRDGLRSLGFWSAACAAGQEPYSLALLVREALADNPGWEVDILATDLSEEMVERTRAGIYSQMEVNRGLPAAQLVANFHHLGRSWRIDDALRSMVRVQRLNLAEPLPPLGQFDVVLLRNVLIYFDPPTRREVLEQVCRCLRPGGYLFLGATETTIGLDDSLERVTFDRATAYRVRGGRV